MRYPSALLAAVASSLLLASTAAAATVHVTTETDGDDGSCTPSNCSLREAVKYSPAGSTVDVPAGNYSLASELVVPRTETIDGAGPGSTVITAGGTHRTAHVTGGAVTFKDLQITGGNANDGAFAGGLLGSSGQLLTLDNVRVTGNSAGGTASLGGGAGIGVNGPAMVRRSLIDQNNLFINNDGAIADSGGGGIEVVGGDLTVVDSEIRDNISDASGALSDTTANVSHNGGGGIYVRGTGHGSLTLLRSTVAGNRAFVAGKDQLHDNGGGGIYADRGAVTAVNSTISDNVVHVPGALLDNGGGGIFVFGRPASLLSVTLAGNSAMGSTVDAGGALYREDAVVTTRDTLFAGNTADLDANCFGHLKSRGHNVEDADTCGLGAAGDKKSTPITLGPLASNGGPTRTRAIFANGPAFDAGAGCPRLDQRGVVRPKGAACDVGAFELAGVPDVVTRPATNVRLRKAVLRGTVRPSGRPTTYSFQYGKTRAYGKTTAVRNAGAGSARLPVSAAVKALKPASRYHFRLVATNSVGTTRGRDRRFITQMQLPARCVRHGLLTVRIGRPAGARVVKARAFAGKTRVARKAGHDVKRLRLRRLPRKAFRLRVVAKLASGESVTGSRRYKPCG